MRAGVYKTVFKITQILNSLMLKQTNKNKHKTVDATCVNKNSTQVTSQPDCATKPVNARTNKNCNKQNSK